jgi:cytochrome c oxidase subunit IV
MHDPHGGPREGEDVQIGPSLEHGHPGAREYVTVAVVLAIITSIEVAVYYIEAVRPVLAPMLLVLSAIKFAAVVLFFMHLKFDNRLFSSLFVGGLILAGALMIALLALFNHLFVA